MLRAEAFIRFPIQGNVLEALDDGRLRIGAGTLLEPGCWVTIADSGRVEIGEGCFLNMGTMIASRDRVTIGDHTMFANWCFVADASHRYDDPDLPITWQGLRLVVLPALALARVPAAPAAASGFSLGVAAGEVKTSSAILWARADKAGAVTLKVKLGTLQVASYTLQAKPANDNTVQKLV